MHNLIMAWFFRQPQGVWVGIGWHPLNSADDKMTNADYVIATFDDSGEVSLPYNPQLRVEQHYEVT